MTLKFLITFCGKLNKSLLGLMSWRPGAYLRASTELFGWLALRAGAQVVSVVLLARALGVEGYGQFVTVLAIASFFTPLVGLGMQGVLLRDGASQPERLPQLLYACLNLWRISLIIVGVVGLTIIWITLPSHTFSLAVVAFFVAEICSSSLTEIVGRAEQARHRTRYYGVIQAALILLRLLALVVYILVATLTTEGWMLIYAAVGLIYSLMLLTWVRRCFLPVVGVGRSIRRQDIKMSSMLIREGLPFLSGALSFKLQAEFNKPLLAKLGFSQAGQFSLAQRALDFASLPISALQDALWPRVFASDDPKHRLFMTGTALMTLALIVGILLILLAPWLPQLLGEDFTPAAELIAWLAGLPALQVLRNLGNVRLLAEGRSEILTNIYIVTTLGNVSMTFVLISRYGLLGSVAAAYCTEILVLITQEVLRCRRKR